MPRPKRPKSVPVRVDDLVCCDRLAEFAFTGEDRLIEYCPRFREFGLPYGWRRGGGDQLLAFCPWCATRLPLGLRDLYFEVASEVTGREIHLCDPVPSAFRSDAWWREREIPFDVGEDVSVVTRLPIAGR